MNRHRSVTPYKLVSAVTALFYVFWFGILPFLSDDLWYMSGMRDYFQGDASPWPLAFETIKDHWLHDNVRLANVVFTVLLIPAKWLPFKWVIASLSGVAVYVTLLLIGRLAGIGNRSGWWAVLVCAMLTFLPVWLDQMVITCFQLNYTWATALTLLAIYCFIDNRGRSPWLMALIGFVIGMWHEGFSLPLFCGCVTLCALWRDKFVNRRCLLMMAAMLAGIAVLMLAPGTVERLDHSIVESDAPLWVLGLQTVKYNVPFVLLVLVSLWLSLTRRMRAVIFTPVFIFVLVCGIAAFCMHVRTHFAPRIGWISTIVAIVGFCCLIRNAISVYKPNTPVKRILKASVAICGLLMVIHLSVVCVYAVRVSDDASAAIDKYRHSYSDGEGDGAVFVEFMSQFHAPLITLQKPYFDVLTYDWALKQATDFYGSPDRGFRVIPTSLERVTPESGTMVPGTEGLRKVGMWYFMPADEYLPHYTQGEGSVTLGKKKIGATFLLQPFVSKADGRPYYFVWPMNMANKALFAPIASMEVMVD